MSNCLTMKEYYHPKFIKQAYGDLTLLNIGDEEVISQICSSGLDSFYDDLLKQDVITEDIREHPDNVIEGMTNPEKKKVQKVKQIQNKLPKVPMKPKAVKKPAAKPAPKPSPKPAPKHRGGGDGGKNKHRRHRRGGHRRRHGGGHGGYYDYDYDYNYPFYYPFFSYFYDDGYYYPRPTTTYVDETVYEDEKKDNFLDKNMKYIFIIAIIVIAIIVLNKSL